MAAVLLVRYGELGLKSPPVRREFEQRLKNNLLDQLLARRLTGRVHSDHGHLYIQADDVEGAERASCRVFGVTSVSVAREISTDRELIRNTVLEEAEPRLADGKSFAIRARRTGQHDFTSQDLARELGAAVLASWPGRRLRVDLNTPDVEITVEVRSSRTYVYTSRRAGPGGLPLGVAGSAVALVDGRRGALGAYLMMKRGCKVDVVATSLGRTFANEVLTWFDPKLSVTECELGDEAAVLKRLAETRRADAVVLPLSVGEYEPARELWSDRVVFSPTVGLSDQEVEARWQRVQELAQ